MAYCTLDDIKKAITSETLTELTDDEGFGEINADRAANAIRQASAVIDAYCGSRYNVPFAEVPNIVRKICIDISIYNLYSRVSLDKEMPKTIQDRHIGAISLLRDISKGIVSIGASPQPASIDGSVEARSSDRVFDRKTMESF